MKGHAASGANKLYARLGAIPTRQDFDARQAGGGQEQDLTLFSPPGNGMDYVLVYADQVDSVAAYDLSAKTSPVLVTGITPTRHGNAAPGTITVSGAGFDRATTVEFVGPDGTVRTPTQVASFVSPSTLTLALDLPSWPAGLYDVRVVKGSASGVLSHALQSLGRLRPPGDQLGRPLGRRLQHPDRANEIWIEYKNTGDLPMPAPLLRVHGDHDASITANPALAIPFRGLGGTRPE